MRHFRLRRIFGLVFLTALIGLGSLHYAVQSRFSSKDFKEWAADKAGHFLKAQVEVDQFQVGFFNQVALNGLEISPLREEEEQEFHFRVERIVFHYDLFRLLTQKFESPSTLLFQAPSVSVQNKTFPYHLFRNLDFGIGQAQISKLKIEGGEIEYAFPSLNLNVRLTGVQGSIKPTGIGRIQMDLNAVASGALQGSIHLKGEVDYLKRSHEFLMDLKSVHLAEDSALPLKALSGTLRWVDQDLFFDGMDAVVHGWKSYLKGSIRNFETVPDVNLDWTIGKDQTNLGLSLRADLASGDLWGAFQPFHQPSSNFSGRIERREQSVAVSDLLIDGGYQGNGVLNFANGDYDFSFSRDRQRFAVSSNMRDLNFEWNVQLDHLRLFGLDWVTAASIRLWPQEPRDQKRVWDFQGEFQTDYFILETMTWDDFHGVFSLNPQGIQDLKSSWGKAFELDGSVRFDGNDPDSRLVLKVNAFDLKEVRQFASKPLPKAIEGTLNGKLKLQGSLRKPEALGDFTVKSGRLGRLEYDLGIVHFRGFPPYLPLQESQILKGRTSLSLDGALDLSLDNMFHGIQIRSPDHMVLWKGWHLDATEYGGDLELDTIVKHLPTLALKAGLESSPNAAQNEDVFQDDQYVAVGPKIKF